MKCEMISCECGHVLTLVTLALNGFHTSAHIVSVLDKGFWICPCSQEHHSCFCRVDVCGRCFHIQCISPSLCLIRVWEPWFESVMLCLWITHILQHEVYSVSTKGKLKTLHCCVLLRMNSLTSNSFSPASTISTLLQNLLLSPCSLKLHSLL